MNGKVSRATVKQFNEQLKGSKIRDVGSVAGVSAHAVQRALERDISIAIIKDVLANYNISYPGTSANGTIHYVLGKYSVIVGADDMVIATVIG